MVGFAEPHPIFAASRQSSQRREQRQTENKVLWLALPSRILSSTTVKVVKGESRDKQKTKFSSLALPRRILSSTTVKVAKGESRDKQKTKFSSLAMPSRILSSLPRGKVAKGESREVKFTVLGYTLFQPKFDI